MTAVGRYRPASRTPPLARLLATEGVPILLVLIIILIVLMTWRPMPSSAGAPMSPS